MASASRLMALPRLASTAASLLVDLSLVKVHPILKAVIDRAAEQEKDVVQKSADAQDAADLLGFSATNCRENGYLQESQALRLAAAAALEDLVDLGSESPQPQEAEAEAGARIAPETLIEAMDQLIIRSLEHLPDPSPAKALQIAQRAFVLARRHHFPHAASRFAAAERQILLQYPDAPCLKNETLSKRRRVLRVRELCDGTEAPTEPTRDAAKVRQIFVEVARVHFLSDDAFNYYSSLRQPVVAKCPDGMIPALEKQKLVELCQGRQLQLMEYDPASELWAKMSSVDVQEQEDRSLGKVMQAWAGGRNLVLFDHPLEAACPELASKLRWPSFLQSELIGQSPYAGQEGQDPFWDHPSLFVQPAGSRCGVHVDGANSQFIQLVLAGRKRWSFWPLGASEQFKFLKRLDKLHLEVWQGSSDLSSEFRHQIRYDQIFPDSLPEAWRVDIEVEAGEMIVVPGGVPHMVANLQDCIAVSRNFVDTSHAQSCADALRWPLPYHDLADFLEQRSCAARTKTI